MTKKDLAVDLAARAFVAYRKALHVAVKTCGISADHPVLLDEKLRAIGGKAEADAARILYVTTLKSALEKRRGK